MKELFCKACDTHFAEVDEKHIHDESIVRCSDCGGKLTLRKFSKLAYRRKGQSAAVMNPKKLASHYKNGEVVFD